MPNDVDQQRTAGASGYDLTPQKWEWWPRGRGHHPLVLEPDQLIFHCQKFQKMVGLIDTGSMPLSALL